uniref:Crossover junction endonuclease MUS81 n=1 Tax=Aegilops tauschii subsp. strangulata TaxID=200361 RepID=A0A452XXB5_AEGTS
AQMAPLVPKKKRKVNLPENEEVAARIFGKHRSMAAQQPGGFPEHQARALSAAYTGVCAAKEPVRTPGDLARVTGVGGWVVDVMEDSFPGSSLDLSPPRSNTPGETGLLLYLKGYCPFNKEEEHTKQTLCATDEISCLCNNDHTLQV